MPRCPIVDPNRVRIPLTGDDWIQVKQRLNYGEYQDLLAAQYVATVDGQHAVDLKNMGMSRVEAYLLAWSFVDKKGDPLPISRATLRASSLEDFVEVMNAVDAHIEALEREASERKKAPDGETGSSAILPSPSITAGDTSGSELLIQTS